MYIQMVTALVLQLIQCVVHSSCEKEEYDVEVDQDALITSSYETATRTAHNFLSVFLKKYGSKQGEEDYRPLFENFVQDLLSTVNKPEWPAAELLLSLLGRLLVSLVSDRFSNYTCWECHQYTWLTIHWTNVCISVTLKSIVGICDYTMFNPATHIIYFAYEGAM